MYGAAISLWLCVIPGWRSWRVKEGSLEEGRRLITAGRILWEASAPPHPPYGHPLPVGARGIKARTCIFQVPRAPTGRGVRGEGASESRRRNRKEGRVGAGLNLHHPGLAMPDSSDMTESFFIDFL